MGYKKFVRFALKAVFLLVLLSSLSSCRARFNPAALPRLVSARLAEVETVSFRATADSPGASKTSLRGSLDLKEPASFSLAALLSFQEGSRPESLNAEAEVRIVRGVAFFRLNQLQTLSFPLVLGNSRRWYQIKENLASTAGEKVLGLVKEEELTSELWKRAKMLLRLRELFSVEQFISEEVVEGQVSRHLSIALRGAELTHWLREAFPSSFQRGDSPAEYLERFTNKRLELWVDRRGSIIKLLAEGTGTLDPYPEVAFRAEILFSGYNEPVEVTAPQAAREFDLERFMEAAGGFLALPHY